MSSATNQSVVPTSPNGRKPFYYQMWAYLWASTATVLAAAVSGLVLSHVNEIFLGGRALSNIHGPVVGLLSFGYLVFSVFLTTFPVFLIFYSFRKSDKFSDSKMFVVIGGLAAILLPIGTFFVTMMSSFAGPGLFTLLGSIVAGPSLGFMLSMRYGIWGVAVLACAGGIGGYVFWRLTNPIAKRR